jgi:hypothetical protein
MRIEAYILRQIQKIKNKLGHEMQHLLVAAKL